MILKLILKILTFSIFFEDRSNRAVFSESVCTSINVYRDSCFNITHGFGENSDMCVCGLKLRNTHQCSQHSHTQTYKDTHFTYIFITVCDQPFYRNKGIDTGTLYVLMIPRPESAVSALLNYSLLNTPSDCCALSMIKYIYNDI